VTSGDLPVPEASTFGFSSTKKRLWTRERTSSSNVFYHIRRHREGNRRPFVMVGARNGFRSHSTVMFFSVIFLWFFFPPQKPLMLWGHEMPLLRLNATETAIYCSCPPKAWYFLNGEHFSTFNGHMWAVWSISVDWKTTKYLSWAVDNTLRLWNLFTGKHIWNVTLIATKNNTCLTYIVNYWQCRRCGGW